MGTRPGSYKVWSPARDRLLRKAWNSETPLKHVAEQLGTTVSALTSRAHLLGLKGKPRLSFRWHPMRTNRLVYLWGTAHSVRDIAALMGTSESAIRAKASDLGLPLRGKKGPRRYMGKRDWTFEESCKAEAMWTAGISGSEIARQLGRSRGSVLGKMYRSALVSVDN